VDIAAGGNNPSQPNNAETAILYGNGDGTFQSAVFPTSLNNFAAQFTADFNNDGKPDLISSGQNSVGTFGAVAVGNGDGTFTVLTSLFGTIAYSVNAVADLNGDGKPDLVVSGQSGLSVPFLTGVQPGNGDGRFGSFINIVSDAYIPTPILIADMNADGRPDLIFGAGGEVDVLFNTTARYFGLAASALLPSTVTAGSPVTSTVTVTPIFGFNGTVTLACAGLPSGASCGFNPPAIAGGSGKSTLMITTSSSTAAGTYSVQAQGSSGSIVNNAALSLIVEAPPDFTIGAASGSPTSQTISAGQTARFSLAIAGTGSFAGTVNLSCAITPAVTPAPTCTLSSSSVQISGSATQSVTVNMGTTTPVTSSSAPTIGFPPGAMPLVLMLTLVGSSWILGRSRKRWSAPAAPMVVLTVLTCVSCGGSGSSSSHTTPGTPTGNYTVTITASSGSLSHSIALQVVVQ
jgi:hypothetical protein